MRECEGEGEGESDGEGVCEGVCEGEGESVRMRERVTRTVYLALLCVVKSYTGTSTCFPSFNFCSVCTIRSKSKASVGTE